MSISGYESYRLYVPIRLHFTQKKFNVFETPRVKNTGIEQYNSRKDRGIFEKLSRRFDEPRECVRYYVANFAYGNNNFLYDPNLANNNYTLWNKRRQSLSYVFENDINNIINFIDEGKLSINNINQQIFNLFIAEEITLETIVILNKFDGLLNEINNSDLKLIWDNDLLRLKKCERFIKFDENKITQLYNGWKNEISRLYNKISS